MRHGFTGAASGKCGCDPGQYGPRGTKLGVASQCGGGQTVTEIGAWQACSRNNRGAQNSLAGYPGAAAENHSRSIGLHSARKSAGASRRQPQVIAHRRITQTPGSQPLSSRGSRQLHQVIDSFRGYHSYQHACLAFLESVQSV
jgi:hypothetical protein